MIRQLGIRDGKVFNRDGRTVQDVIQLPPRKERRVGREMRSVGTAKACHAAQETCLAMPREHIEIPCEDARLVGGVDDVAELLELMLTRPKSQREVNQQETNRGEFHFDHEALASFVKIMKRLADGFRSAEDGVGLLAKDGKPFKESILGIFDFPNVLHAKAFGNDAGLIFFPHSIGAGVHLDKPDDIGILPLQKIRNGGDVIIALSQIPAPRPSHGMTGAVSDVVEDKTHWGEGKKEGR